MTFKNSTLSTFYSFILFTLFASCDTGVEAVATDTKSFQKPDWTAYQKILDIGIVKNSYKGTYGIFSHNAFDYKKLIKHEKFKDFINTQIKSLKKTKAPIDTSGKLAFWINAYNFFTIVDVCSGFPVKSMKDIGWKNVRHQVGNSKYSLDHIEHKILRPLGEPKIHFAINCASVSCPSLYEKVLKQEDILETLTQLTKAAMKNPLHISPYGNKVKVSKLMDWFESDFKVKPYDSANGFIKAMAPDKLKKDINGYLKYDWNLNSPENIKSVMKKLNF